MVARDSLTPLEEVDQLFDVVRDAKILVHHVRDDRFRDFSNSLQDLIIELGDQSSDPFSAWYDIIRFLKRVRFVLTTSPLSPTQAIALSDPPEGWPDGVLNRFKATHPNLRPFLEEAVGLLGALPEGTTELGEALERHVSHATGSFAVVTKNASVAAETQSALGMDAEPIRVVTHRELRSLRTFDQLMVLGPIGWYPDHLRASPRALETHVLVHPWIRDKYVVEPVLGDLGGTSKRVSPPVEVRTRDDVYKTEREPIDLSDLVPGYTSSEVSEIGRSRSAQRSRRAPDSDVPVSVRVFILASGHLIFLPSDSDARRAAGYIDEDGNLEVGQVPVSSLGPDTYLLVRTGESGDYVEQVANQLLLANREDFGPLRSDQRVWKERLRREVSVDGPSRIAGALRNLGIDYASPGNVRRWCSMENIGLGDDGKFRILLRYLDLEDRAENIIRSTHRLRAAHQAAGAHIREQLLEQADHIDTRSLEREGSVEVELEGVDAGTLMLTRIEQVGDEELEVAHSEVGVLEELG